MMLVYLIIGATALVSVTAFSNRDLFVKLLFNANIIRSNRQWYRFVTHAFVHADWIHLFMNMYVLFMFGKIVEEQYIELFGAVKGRLYFFLLYFISTAAASLPSYEKHKHNIAYSAVGASGAVSAVLFSAIFLDPGMKLNLFFPPVRNVPAPIFGVLYLVYCWYAAKHARDNVAHDVHYWGSIFGIVFTLVIYHQSFFNFIEAVKNLFG